MANEDSRENSVVGGAIKTAAIGLTIYGAAKGGRSLIKNYDDLGRTFGKAGDKASNKILGGLSKFDKADGSGNAIREGLDKMQTKILDKDHTKLVNKTASMYEELGINGMNDDAKKELHEIYTNQNRYAKRDTLDTRKNINKGLKEDVKTQRLEEAEVAREKAKQETKEQAKEQTKSQTKEQAKE